MSVSDLLASLKRRHARLEQRIAFLLSRPGSDDLEIARLKREKLRLRDRMAMAR